MMIGGGLLIANDELVNLLINNDELKLQITGMKCWRW